MPSPIDRPRRPRPLPVRALLWLVRSLALLTLALAVLLSCAWAMLAIGYSNLPWTWLRVVAAVLFGAGTLLLFARLWWRRAAVGYWLAFAAVATWWLLIPPSHDRDWTIDNSVMPRAHVDGDLVTIEGVRHFEYRSEDDFTPRWEERTYDVSKLEAIDLVLSYWDGKRDIAHMIVSFGFAGGEWLAVSIETRKEKGEGYSTVAGFFKQFELIFVAADERDLIGLRTNHRGEDVYVYPLCYDRYEQRELFLAFVRRINELADDPEWYNALEHNCTTAWVGLVEGIRGLPMLFDIRILRNGYLDQLGYERGRLVADETQGLPYEEMRARHAATAIAREIGIRSGFSTALRARLPKRQ